MVILLFLKAVNLAKSILEEEIYYVNGKVIATKNPYVNEENDLLKGFEVPEEESDNKEETIENE